MPGIETGTYGTLDVRTRGAQAHFISTDQEFRRGLDIVLRGLGIS